MKDITLMKINMHAKILNGLLEEELRNGKRSAAADAELDVFDQLLDEMVLDRGQYVEDVREVKATLNRTRVLLEKGQILSRLKSK